MAHLPAVWRPDDALFLQLDLEALPEELGGALGSGLLQMFYCVSQRDCPIRGEGRLDPFSPYQLLLAGVCPSPDGPPSVPPTFDLELPALGESPDGSQ